MPRTGRPTRLTAQVQQRICQSLEAGNSFAGACEAAGISAAAGKQWRQRGDGRHPNRGPDMKFVDFVTATRKAEAIAEALAVESIRLAAVDGTWQAAAWWLERRHSARWSRVRRAQVVPLGADADRVEIIVDLAARCDAKLD